MDQRDTPLFTALGQHSQGAWLPLHVPGHKAGRAVRDDLVKSWGRAVFAHDVTELDGLDDLHAPSGVIAQAERLAAEAVGAEHTAFLTAGSTAGLLAAILAVCSPGDRVLVPRNAHRSVIAGIILAGALPVFIWPQWEGRGTPAPLTRDEVERQGEAHPRLRAMVLLHPTYFGRVGDTAALIGWAQERGLRVIVDEAHGAHFPFSQYFPASAIALGADVVVQSWHKTLGALTGGAMLHCPGQDGQLWARIRRFLRMVHTTSPSYLVLASLDVARSHAATAPAQRWLRVREYYEAIEVGLRDSPLLEVNPSRRGAQDPVKLLLRTKGFSGWALGRALGQAGAHVELAGENACLLVLSAGEKPLLPVAEFLQLLNGAATVASRVPAEGRLESAAWWERRPVLVMDPQSASLAASEMTPLGEAVGRVVAEMVVLYPPGQVICCPGESLDEITVELLSAMLGQGYRFHGVGSPPDYPVTVVRE